MIVDGVSFAGFAAPFLYPSIHTRPKLFGNLRLLLREISGFLRVLDKVVKLDRRLTVEIGFKRFPELPERRAP